MTMEQQKRTRERILASITMAPESGCWHWIRQVSNSGYGRITLSYRDGTYMESTQRASHRALTGPLPEHGMIRQTCGNRLCVNPDHLEHLTEKR